MTYFSIYNRLSVWVPWRNTSRGGGGGPGRAPWPGCQGPVFIINSTKVNMQAWNSLCRNMYSCIGFWYFFTSKIKLRNSVQYLSWYFLQQTTEFTMIFSPIVTSHDSWNDYKFQRILLVSFIKNLSRKSTHLPFGDLQRMPMSIRNKIPNSFR